MLLLGVKVVPVLIGGAAYWILGALWFSVLFGGVWSKGLEAQGVSIPTPTRRGMAEKMGITFLCTLLASFTIGLLIRKTGLTSSVSALKLALAVSVGVGATGLGIAYAWESKRLQVFLVDAGYQLAGLLTCALIHTLWS